MVKIPILMYHSIESMPKSTVMRSLHVHPKSFKLQMWLLKIFGYQGLSMKELMPYLKGEKQGKVVGITFDDGYKNNLTNAAPILKQYGFSATCYFVSKRFGQSNVWDLEHNITQRPLMIEEEIKQWQDYGFEIGAHTQTHNDLEKATYDEANLEISECKKDLENEFNCKVDSFCYPYGRYNESAIEIVKKNGFTNAITMHRGRNLIKEEDLLRLKRIPVNYRTLPHLFLMKIFTKYEEKKN